MKRILLTGSTGVLGHQILKELIDLPSCEIILLIRATGPAHLAQRFQQIIKQLPQSHDFSRISAVQGDLTQDNLGLDFSQESRLRTLTNIIHCAADISLDVTALEAEKGILKPCYDLLKLMDQMQGNCRLDYVSTVGVIGKSPHSLPEQIIQFDRRFNNNYEEYKSKAELVLNDHYQKNKGITIHRPSMIVGNSKTGQIPRFQVFYFLLSVLTGKRFFGLIPDLLSYRVDTIPVDTVAKGIVMAMQTNESNFVFNHCSGAEQSLTLLEIRKILENEKPNLGPLRPLSIQKIRSLLIFFSKILKFVKPRVSERFTIFQSLLDYHDANPRFENTQTQIFYRKNKINFVSPREHMKCVIQYYLRIKGGSL